MSLIFPFSLILSAFCLYHAYKNNTEQRWFWLIIFLPLIGSLIYLYYHFYNRNTISTVTENLNQAVNTNHKIEKLEREVVFSDTIKNKTLLAEEYVKVGAYEKAIELYKFCLKGSYADDPDLLMGLIKASYLNKNYDVIIDYVKPIENEKIFQNSEERIAYAWALFNTGAHRKAEEVFQAMDHQFTNYEHRLEYANFLLQENRRNEARDLLEILIDEIEHMDRNEKINRRSVYNAIKNLHKTI